MINKEELFYKNNFNNIFKDYDLDEIKSYNNRKPIHFGKEFYNS